MGWFLPILLNDPRIVIYIFRFGVRDDLVVVAYGVLFVIGGTVPPFYQEKEKMTRLYRGSYIHHLADTCHLL